MGAENSLLLAVAPLAPLPLVIKNGLVACDVTPLSGGYEDVDTWTSILRYDDGQLAHYDNMC